MNIKLNKKKYENKNKIKKFMHKFLTKKLKIINIYIKKQIIKN